MQDSSKLNNKVTCSQVYFTWCWYTRESQHLYWIIFHCLPCWYKLSIMRRYITLALCSSYLNYVLLPVFWSCHSFVSFAFVWCLRWSVDNGTCTVSKKKKCWWNQFLTHKNLTKSFVGWTRKSFLLSYHYLDSIAIQNEYTIIMLPDYEIIVKIWCCNMSHVLPTFVYQPYPDRIAVDKNSDYSKTIQEN